MLMLMSRKSYLLSHWFLSPSSLQHLGLLCWGPLLQLIFILIFYPSASLIRHDLRAAFGFQRLALRGASGCCTGAARERETVCLFNLCNSFSIFLPRGGKGNIKQNRHILTVRQAGRRAAFRMGFSMLEYAKEKKEGEREEEIKRAR